MLEHTEHHREYTRRKGDRLHTAGRWVALIIGILTIAAFAVGIITFTVRATQAAAQLSYSVRDLATAVGQFKPAIESMTARLSKLEQAQIKTDVVDAEQQATLQDHGARLQYLERQERRRPK